MSAEDRLSSLSDDVLHSILVRIPIKQQVKTSILSRRWRNLWSLNPLFLDLGSGFGRETAISTPLSLLHILRRWRSPHLQKLRAPVLTSTLDPLISFAMDKSVRHLSITSYDRKEADLPQSFFSNRSSRNLTTLSLQGSFRLFPFPTEFHGFSSLRSLSLGTVEISDDDLTLLLSLSPLLDSLGLMNCYNLRTIVLKSSSRITDLDVRRCVGLRRIDAGRSCLRKLTCVETNLALDHIPSLEEAALFDGYDIELLLKVSHVPVIHLDTCFFKCLSAHVFPKGTAENPIIFNNVRELHLNLDDLTYKVLRSLALLLKQCPFLHKLYIQMGNMRPMKGRDGNLRDGNLHDELVCDVPEWKRKLAFQVLSFQPLNHLKFVSLRNLLDTPSQLDIVKYLLAKGTAIESFHIVAFQGRKEKMVKELALFPRSSANIHMVVTGEPDEPRTEAKFEPSNPEPDEYCISDMFD